MKLPVLPVHSFEDDTLNWEAALVQGVLAWRFYGPFTVNSGSIAVQTESGVLTVTGLGISQAATVANIVPAGITDGAAGFAARLTWRHTGVNIAAGSDSFVFFNTTAAGGPNSQGILTFYVLANA